MRTLIAILILMTGCARYEPSPLAQLPIAERGGLAITAKPFTKEDCRRYLDRDVIDKGFQPVQLYFSNETSRTFLFSLNRMSIPHADPEDVARKVHTWTVGRVAGYGAATLIASPFFVIPAFIDGINSTRANVGLDRDFEAKAAHDQKIEPHSYANMVLFVPKELYREPISITLIDEQTQKPITLTPQQR